MKKQHFSMHSDGLPGGNTSWYLEQLDQECKKIEGKCPCEGKSFGLSNTWGDRFSTINCLALPAQGMTTLTSVMGIKLMAMLSHNKKYGSCIIESGDKKYKDIVIKSSIKDYGACYESLIKIAENDNIPCDWQ